MNLKQTEGPKSIPHIPQPYQKLAEIKLLPLNIFLKIILFFILSSLIHPSSSEFDQVDLLISEAKKIKDINPKDCLKNANKALELAVRIKYEKGEANAILIIELEKMAYLSGSSVLNLNDLSRACSLFEKYNDKKGIAFCSYLIGFLFYRKSNKDYDKALKYFQKAKEICNEIHDVEIYSGILFHIGDIYYFRGQYEKALEYFVECEKNGIKIGDYITAAYAVHNIGTIYFEILKNDKKAEEYFFEADKIFKKNGFISGQAYVLESIGRLYAKQKKIQGSFKSFFGNNNFI